MPELAAVVGEQTRPRSVLRPALLMACDDVTHGLTTPLGFYAGQLLVYIMHVGFLSFIPCGLVNWHGDSVSE